MVQNLQGTIDDQIIELLEPEAGESGFVADVIWIFCNDCEKKIFDNHI